ncbi:MAG: hypothetical protein N4A45_06750 [Flavobacteriales bacterium]|jgi:hypothetical protein|nr:hypothetical protein [Flavobacteriales bacterium]
MKGKKELFLFVLIFLSSFWSLQAQEKKSFSWIKPFLDKNPQESAINTQVKEKAQSAEHTMLMFEQIGDYYAQKKQTKTSLKYYLDAYEWMKIHGNKKVLHHLELKLAKNYQILKKHNKAIQFGVKSRDFFQKNNEKQALFETNFLLGNIYLDLDQSTFATTYVQDVFEYGISENSPESLMKAYYLQGKYHQLENKQSNASNFLNNALKYAKEIGDRNTQASIYLEQAKLFEKTQKFASAIRQLELAFKELSHSQDNNLRIAIVKKMATLQSKQGKDNESLKYLEEAYKLSKEHHYAQEQADIMKKMVLLALENENTTKASEYVKIYNTLSDSIYEIGKENNLQAVEDREKIQRQGKLISFYKEEIDAKENRFWIVSVFLVLLIGVLLLLARTLRKSKQLVEKEKELLESKRALAKMELERARSELDENREHLSQITTLIIEKNAQIRKLLEQVEKLKEMDQFSASGNTEKIKMVDELLAFKILTEDDWSEFRKIYNQVFEGVEAKLKLHHANLTKSEKKLFMISKLKLSLDEVADLLAISPESVRKARYRLKKKLALEKENLQDYIDRF